MNNLTKAQKEAISVEIIIGFELGKSLKELAEQFNKRQSTVLRIISSYDKLKIKPTHVRVHIGSKDEPYYSEKEMLKGFPKYSVKSLSGSEKIILKSKKLKEWYEEEMYMNI